MTGNNNVEVILLSITNRQRNKSLIILSSYLSLSLWEFFKIRIQDLMCLTRGVGCLLTAQYVSVFLLLYCLTVSASVSVLGWSQEGGDFLKLPPWWRRSNSSLEKNTHQLCLCVTGTIWRQKCVWEAIFIKKSARDRQIYWTNKRGVPSIISPGCLWMIPTSCQSDWIFPKRAN